MEFINNTLSVAKRELAYQWHGKRIIAVLVILMVLCAVHLFGLYNGVQDNYEMYRRTEAMHIAEGEDPVAILGEGMNVYIYDEAKTVDNPLKLDFINLSISIQHLMPQQIISNTLEYLIFVFATLLFGIYAAYVATHDFKKGTYKLLSVQKGQGEIIAGKIFAVVIIMLGTLGVSLLFTFLGSFGVRAMLERNIPTQDFRMNMFVYDYGLAQQLIFTILVLVFYIILGWALGYIFKDMIVTTIILLLFGLLIPVLGAYDFRNIFSYFAHEIFSFQARFVMFSPMEINRTFGTFLIWGIPVVALLVSVYIGKTRSSYK